MRKRSLTVYTRIQAKHAWTVGALLKPRVRGTQGSRKAYARIWMRTSRYKQPFSSLASSSLPYSLPSWSFVLCATAESLPRRQLTNSMLKLARPILYIAVLSATHPSRQRFLGAVYVELPYSEFVWYLLSHST